MKNVEADDFAIKLSDSRILRAEEIFCFLKCLESSDLRKCISCIHDLIPYLSGLLRILTLERTDDDMSPCLILFAFLLLLRFLKKTCLAEDSAEIIDNKRCLIFCELCLLDDDSHLLRQIHIDRHDHAVALFDQRIIRQIIVALAALDEFNREEDVSFLPARLARPSIEEPETVAAFQLFTDKLIEILIPKLVLTLERACCTVLLSLIIGHRQFPAADIRRDFRSFPVLEIFCTRFEDFFCVPLRDAEFLIRCDYIIYRFIAEKDSLHTHAAAGMNRHPLLHFIIEFRTRAECCTG